MTIISSTLTISQEGVTASVTADRWISDVPGSHGTWIIRYEVAEASRPVTLNGEMSQNDVPQGDFANLPLALCTLLGHCGNVSEGLAGVYPDSEAFFTEPADWFVKSVEIDGGIFWSMQLELGFGVEKGET